MILDYPTSLCELRTLLYKLRPDKTTGQVSLRCGLPTSLFEWSFDKGLMSVGKSYEVLVSKLVMVEQNYLGHILTLTDRPIFTPEQESFWPAQDNLHWHRRNTFRR